MSNDVEDHYSRCLHGDGATYRIQLTATIVRSQIPDTLSIVVAADAAARLRQCPDIPKTGEISNNDALLNLDILQFFGRKAG